METPGQLIPGSPPSNHLAVKLVMDESLEQFLEQFFVHYAIDEIAQQLLRATLAKNMIRSIYSLSRASPNALILSGIPAVFVDECTRSGMFSPEENDEDKLAVTSSSVQTGSKLQNANKWSTIESAHGHASLDTPYRRDTPNSQRAENWSVDEMMILLEAKKVEDEISVASRLCKKIRPARETWKAISDRLVQKNVRKTPHQCWIKWVKLNKSFRKIYRYEKNISSSQESFWNLSTKARKEKSMPTSFHQDVYSEMVEKFGDVKEARRGGRLIELSTPGEERSIGGDALQTPPEAHDDLLSISSQHLNFELQQPKRQRTIFPIKGERMQSTKQLIMHYEDMENKKLQIERHRILSDEKRNASLCNSIAEIANAIRSIADALHPKP
ncbi:hypothetical protein O6H91_01G006400 [Diphasiastrum complanatum]|uniref:Uncharacterized protein n=1 Tax=Diphasiastrum complanatum TaxID=34168 RepID=A0ACC2EMS8_DIPCM|nr:hypothetical protein O6H91_01G006400 [Diphasiastrum complanatum]